MPKMNVAKSITINAPQQKIKEFLADFHNWTNWSPWLICEPEATINYADNGKYYKWEGNRVGGGEMKVTAEKDNRIDYDLTFLKPWKSRPQLREGEGPRAQLKFRHDADQSRERTGRRP